MELLDYPINLKSWKEEVTVHLFGDIHRAALGCDHKQLRADIKKLKEANERGERHRWLGTGDWCNSIGPKDKRHDSTAIASEFRHHVGDDLFRMEVATLVREFESIRDYGIGIGTGNHEDTIARNSEYNPSRALAQHLNLPYLDYSAVIRFRLTAGPQVRSVILYWHHGYGASRTKGAKLNMLYNMRDVLANADVYAVGHVHELLDFPEVRMEASHAGQLRLTQKPILFINNGTYLKAYATDTRPQKAMQFNPELAARSDYAEKKAYRPSVIGHNGFTMQLQNDRKGLGRGRNDWKVKLNRVDFTR
jgi:hypothetical protein